MRLKGYTANFETKGNWIIPWVLGFSKSTVSFGSHRIGIMYTLHITPFINIGLNNPKPKQKPMIEEVNEFSELDLLLDRISDEYVYSQESDTRITGIAFNEDDNKITFFVISEDVEIPEEIEGYKTEKIISGENIMY